LAASGVGRALLVKEVVSNADDIEVQLGALVEKAQAIEQLGAVANGVASLRIGDLVAAVDLHVVATSIVGLSNGDLVDRGVSLNLRGSGDRDGQESDNSHGMHVGKLGCQRLVESNKCF